MKDRSLKKTIQVSALVFVFVASFITLSVNYLISSNIVKNKIQIINESLTESTVKKTNTILNEIVEVFNLSIKNEYLDDFLDFDPNLVYDEFIARDRYEGYLKNIIVNQTNVDSIIINSGISAIKAVNTVNIDYSDLTDSTFFIDNKSRYLSSSNQFWIDKIDKPNYERLVISTMVYKPYSTDVIAIVSVVLSKQFSDQLDFSKNDFEIVDAFGNKFGFIKTNNGYSSIMSSDLIFNNWKLNKILYDNKSIFFKFRHKLIFPILFIILYLMLVVPFSTIATESIITPLKILNFKINYGDKKFKEHKESKIKNFRVYLIILYFALILIPISVITTYFYINLKNTIENEIGNIYENNSEILAEEIESKIESFNRLGMDISLDKNTQNYLINSSSVNEEVINQLILSKDSSQRKIVNMALFNLDRDLIYSSKIFNNFIQKQHISDDLIFIEKNYGKPIFKIIEDPILGGNILRIGLQVRSIQDNNTSGKRIGTIVVDLDANTFIDSIKDFEIKTGAQLLIANEYINKIMYKTKGSEESRSRYINAQDSNFVITTNIIDRSSWELKTILPLSIYTSEGRFLLLFNIVLLLGLISISLIFIFIFSFETLKNVYELDRTIIQIKKGNFSARFKQIKIDEIAELGNSINLMLGKIENLIEEKVISETKIKDAQYAAKQSELNLLQSQINPHFLYNTLKTVQYMIFSSDSRAEVMVKLLIKIFKSGIFKSGKMIPLFEELDYIKSYEQIQRIRFSDSFTIIYEIPEDILYTQILKLSLQPLIENAIHHGFENIDYHGEINISAFKDDKLIYICVEDNGKGIKDNTLDEIRAQLDGTKQRSNIGLSNVQERIHLYYGYEYGLEIKSRKGVGTKVTLTIPV